MVYAKQAQLAKTGKKRKECRGCNKTREIRFFSTPRALKCDDCKRRAKRVKRQSSKSYVTKQKDRELRELILKRDKICQKCGSTKTLQVSHVYTKKAHPELRHDPMNVKLLCYRCHFYWWHREIIEAFEWFEEKFPSRYEYLRGKIREDL